MLFMGVTGKNLIESEITRNEILRLFREDPNISQEAIAATLGISISTVVKHIATMREKLHDERMQAYDIYLSNQLAELHEIKKECRRRLEGCKNAASGSRWLEMQLKAMEKEARLLGLNAPERSIVANVRVTKEQRDAAVKAAQRQMDVPSIPTTKADVIDAEIEDDEF
jgi:DNA-binding Lrp family transcriptional regulator